MNTQSSSKKSLIGGTIIIAVLVLGYFMFKNPEAPQSGSLLQAEATPQANAAGVRVLSLLNQIESLKIDTSIFNSPAYQTLIDFSVAIPQLNVGRANPFAPLPGSASAAAAGSSSGSNSR